MLVECLPWLGLGSFALGVLCGHRLATRHTPQQPRLIWRAQAPGWNSATRNSSCVVESLHSRRTGRFSRAGARSNHDDA